MKYSQNPCQNSQNRCEREMSSASISIEVSEGLRRLSEPVRAGESVKALIAKAARKVGLSYSRAFSLWYGRGVVRAEELERVRALLRTNRQENLNAEIAELRERLARLEEQASGFGARVGGGALR